MVIPLAGNLTPGAPAHMVGGLQVVENMMPVWGAYRSVPRLSGAVTTVGSGTQPGEGRLGLITDVHGSTVGLFIDPDASKPWQADGADPEDFIPSISPEFDQQVPIMGVRHNMFVGSEQFTGYETRSEGVLSGSFEAFGQSGIVTPWEFAQFGDRVIAHNYWGPQIQFDLSLPPGQREWEESILSDFKPRAKYVTIIGAHILQGNIRLQEEDIADAGDLGGVFRDKGGVVIQHQPQLIWWSSTETINEYGTPIDLPGRNTDFQYLFDVPGEITGIAGFPDAALILKRFGLHVMRLTGGPGLFTFNTLEIGSGCTTPASIVVVDQDVYFLSQDGFRVSKSFQTSQPIMPPSLRKEFLDTRFGGDFALIEGIRRTIYDSSGRVVIWLYDDVALCYGVEDGQWSFLEAEEIKNILEASWIAEQYHLNGLYLWNVNPTNANQLQVRRWLESDNQEIATLPSRIRSKTFSLMTEPGQPSTGRLNVFITRVRPLFRSYADFEIAKIEPEVFITSSMDPNMSQDRKDVRCDPTSGKTSHNWYVPPRGKVIGEHFEIEIRFPEAKSQALWEVSGFQVEFVVAGRR